MEPDTTEILDFSKTENFETRFYLVDSSSDSVYGPYTKDEYLSKIQELGITSLGDWIKTTPRPEGAK